MAHEVTTTELLTKPFGGGPGLYVFAIILSIVLVLIVVFLTKIDEQPRYYKMIYSYCGFVMAVSWIYSISAEVVDVVSMLGFVSGLDQTVLGLTIIAWSNSMGDLITDISVARQGYPRMAMAAAIGGPLFNLLIGFGLPFSIALIKGSTVVVEFDGVNMIMIIFLGCSVVFSTAYLVVTRGNLLRAYSIVLILLYVGFILCIILHVTNVVSF